MPKQLIIGAVGIGTDLNPPLIRVIDTPTGGVSTAAPNPFNPAPPATCPTSGSITLVLSGVVSCGCQGGNILTPFADGTYTLTWDGGGFSIFGVGSWSLQSYSDDDCTNPMGDPQSGAFNIEASCTDGLWLVEVITDIDAIGVFVSAESVPLGSSVGNEVSCPDSLAGGGTATLS